MCCKVCCKRSWLQRFHHTEAIWSNQNQAPRNRDVLLFTAGFDCMRFQSHLCQKFLVGPCIQVQKLAWNYKPTTTTINYNHHNKKKKNKSNSSCGPIQPQFGSPAPSPSPARAAWRQVCLHQVRRESTMHDKSQKAQDFRPSKKKSKLFNIFQLIKSWK